MRIPNRLSQHLNSPIQPPVGVPPSAITVDSFRVRWQESERSNHDASCVRRALLACRSGRGRARCIGPLLIKSPGILHTLR